MDEAELIQRFQNDRDLSAAEALLTGYENRLYQYLYRVLGHRQDAEDALSETFGKALRGLEKYEERCQFKSWIFRIAHHEAINVIRRRERVVVQEEPAKILEESGAGGGVGGEARFLERLMTKERLEQLRRAIPRLPVAEREVLLLRMKSELSFKEIAEVTDSPLNTVLGRMHNAKKRLRELILEQEAEEIRV
ncbi:MAG: RNA polymerase sigma factor [Verrucomicrobiota bacterium]